MALSHGMDTFSFNIVRKNSCPPFDITFICQTRGKKKKGFLFSAAFLKAQPHNSLVLVILVNSNVAQRLAHVGMVEYILERNRIMRLLVHMVAERLTQCMRAYAAESERFPGFGQDIVRLLAADRLVREIRGFEQILKILFPLYVIYNDRLQFRVDGKALLLSGLILPDVHIVLFPHITDTQFQYVRYPEPCINTKQKQDMVPFIFRLKIICHIQHKIHLPDRLYRIQASTPFWHEKSAAL